MLSPDLVAESLASWVHTCARAWSPWLFGRADVYTTVAHLDVIFHGVPDAQREAIGRALGCDSESRVVFDGSRYNEWSYQFKFTSVPLDMHITPEMAYFEDSLGRQSRYTFEIGADDMGPAYRTAAPAAEAIPWLLCVS